MAIPKVCGIETEYGIVVRGADLDPIKASSLLVNAYVSATNRKVSWDFQDETPANDARGVTFESMFAPQIETNLVNAVLTNGARYYVDHAHPEISIPEVRDASEAVRWDRAADEIIRASMSYARRYLDGAEVIVHKNNSDGKGNSYGCHENYLVDRQLAFSTLANKITPHFVTRQIFCGAGKVGSEKPGEPFEAVPYQLSQRADFFEEPVGLETTVKRPIVNTRDEPHCDAAKYRRLHVIVGDANMSEVATFLKVGTTSLILAMIEDGAVSESLTIADPVAAIQTISQDPSLQATIRLLDGRSVRAIEVQYELLESAQRYAATHGLDSVGEEVGKRVLDRWEIVLEQLSTDPDSAASVVDWVAKKRLIDGFAQRHDLPPAHARLKAIDLQYHDLRVDRCLATRAGLETLFPPAAVDWAVTNPPESTRAYFRGRCLSKFGDQVTTANWDSIVFDTGRDSLQRVPMMEPLRGTADLVGSVIDQSDTVTDLLDRLRQ